jgi:hypothetical protein
MGRRCSWRTRAMPCDGTDDYATSGSGQTVSVGSTGLREQCRSTRRCMFWVFIILTSLSFFLDPSVVGDELIRLEHQFFVVTILL